MAKNEDAKKAIKACTVLLDWCKSHKLGEDYEKCYGCPFRKSWTKADFTTVYKCGLCGEPYKWW